MIRRCGKRYEAPEDAWRSKAGQRPDAEVTDCRAGCGGYHVVKPPGPPRARRRPKGTGPTPEVRRLVLERDGGCCVCCGVCVAGQPHSLQHRKRRSQGGGNLASNLITVLGTGTTGCHERIDSRRDPHDEAKGYTVRSWGNPADVPVMIFSAGGSGVRRYLWDDGSYAGRPQPPALERAA